MGGGRTTVSIGAASEAACVEVRSKLLKYASKLLQTKEQDLFISNNRIEIKGKAGSGLASRCCRTS